MTPRQIAAYCFLIARREDLQSHRELSVALLAKAAEDAEGFKTVEKQLEQWESENS